ncbi:MAG: septum formation protein Maf [Rhodospirillales bacterium]|jgi:septum formation protein|nr:septum formation protein Maf [Rhodospirillales bacterium]MBT4006343.1 septum formation protein Maf [Rhodospirillales bacterium]MBT5075488.1 septum formation protein Maf [Rhodospirillales bacterium]MBT5114220.1 septum formation protein Maf [Rhodospirillales bacterium]MBT5673090.1 septum formation protein Maf [Rhodospirillales bacterium]
MAPPETFVLASASPRRRDLLVQIGRDPDLILPPDIDETPRLRETPVAYAGRMAREKAELIAARDEVRSESRGAFVLGADTVVACGRRILPKGDDAQTARACLALLSGRRHRVLGAVAVVTPDGKTHERLVSTAVSFKRLEACEIDRYIASGEWEGKAGAYAIQGLASIFVKALNGSYSNVVGLPLFEVNALLDGLGCYVPETRFKKEE